MPPATFPRHRLRPSNHGNPASLLRVAPTLVVSVLANFLDPTLWAIAFLWWQLSSMLPVTLWYWFAVVFTMRAGRTSLYSILLVARRWWPPRRTPNSLTELRQRVTNALLVESKIRSSSNSHPGAARRRRSAEDLIENIVVSCGYAPYYVQMSNHNATTGKEGSRELIDAKDHVSYDFTCDDNVRDNTVFILTDVDYHMSRDQLNALAQTGKPILVYTITPNALAGTSDGISVHWDGDGKWHTRVANNLYAHSLWNWEGETRIFNRYVPSYTLVPLLLFVAMLLAAGFNGSVYDGPVSMHADGSCTVMANSTSFMDGSIACGLSEYRFASTLSTALANTHTNLLHHALPVAPRHFDMLHWILTPAQELAFEVKPTMHTLTYPSCWFEPTAFMTAIDCTPTHGALAVLGRALSASAAAAHALYLPYIAFTIVAVMVSVGCTVLARVEVTNVGQQRSLVAVIPVSRFSPMAYALYLLSVTQGLGSTPPPMSRLEPTVRGLYSFLEVTQLLPAPGGSSAGTPDVDASYISMCRTGSRVSHQVPFRAIEALRVVIRALGKPPPGATAMTTLKKNGHDCNAEQALAIVECVIALGEGVELTQANVLHRDGSPLTAYTFGPRRDEQLAKPTVRSYMGQMIGNGAVTARRCVENMRAGIEIRVTRPANDALPTKADIELRNEFNRLAVKEIFADGHPLHHVCDPGVVLERQARKTQQEMLRVPIQTGDPNAPADDFRGNLKCGECSGKPRIITTPASNEWKLFSSAVGYALSPAFYLVHWSFSGLNYRKVANRIREAARKATNETEIDVSNMDGSHGQYDYDGFLQFCLAIFDPADHDAVSSYVRDSFHRTVRTNAGAYDQGYALGSGLWLTTMYNTYTGALMSYRMRRKLLAEDEETAYSRIGGHSGDDSIMFSTPDAEAITACYAELGFTIKCTTYEVGSRAISFLARIYDTTDGSSMPDLPRLLSKINITALPAIVPDATVAALRWAAIAWADGASDVIGPLARKVLEGVTPGFFDKLQAREFDGRGWIHTFFVSGYGWSEADTTKAIGYTNGVSMLENARPIRASWGEEYFLRSYGPTELAEINSYIHNPFTEWHTPPVIRTVELPVSPAIPGGEQNGWPMPDSTDPAEGSAPDWAAPDLRASASSAADSRPTSTSDDVSEAGPCPKDAEPEDAATGAATKEPAAANATPKGKGPGPESDQLALITSHPEYADTLNRACKAGWGVSLDARHVKRIVAYGPLEVARWSALTKRGVPNKEIEANRIPFSKTERQQVTELTARDSAGKYDPVSIAAVAAMTHIAKRLATN